jgi:xylulokinase
LLGAGIIDPATMLLSLSTGAQVMVPATAVEIDPNGRMHTFCAALEPSDGHPGWYQMGATLAAGLAVRWLGEVLFALAETDLDSHLIDLAARAPLGADGLLFLPYLVGERTPHMDALARAAFAGLTARHDRATIARAVIEGVTFAAYDAFTVLAGAGANPRQIVAVGGGARSAWWRQLAADLFGLPVAFVGTADQAALGAAMLAAASQGADPLDWALRWSTTGVPLPPDPLRHQRYRDLFALYRRAAQSTIELSHDLARFADRSNRGKD